MSQSIQVPKSLLRLQLDCYSKIVYALLLTYAEGKVSVREMERALRISRKKLRQSLNALEAQGMVSRIKNPISANRFQFIFAALPENQWKPSGANGPHTSTEVTKTESNSPHASTETPNVYVSEDDDAIETGSSGLSIKWT